MYASKNTDLGEPDWYLKVFCCAQPTVTSAPQKVSLLTDLGLGYRDILVQNYKTVSEEAFEDILLKEYPLLKKGGGFDLFVVKAGRLKPLSGPRSPANIYPQVHGNNRKLYIRPNKAIELDYSVLTELAQSNRRVNDPQGQLRRLAFDNPGAKSKFLEDFDPERSSREMRKMKRKIYTQKPRKAANAVYDEHGLLVGDNRDLCDCCERSCPGCHFPCRKCRSTKCGLECRSYRKYTYAQIEVEGTNRTFHFVDVTR